ncbi:MAG: trans-sulfuration enzyme family protein [Planctomycetaceae bacterium]
MVAERGLGTVAEEPVVRMGETQAGVTRPSVSPIYQTTAFDVPDLDVLQQLYAGQVTGDIYTRDSNPGMRALAQSVAALEGTEAGAVFASGMGSLGSIFLTLLSAGDHVLTAQSLYGKTLQLASRMQRFNVAVSAFDVGDPQQLGQQLRPETKFVLVETVANPLLEVADIERLASAAGAVPLIVDSTFTTPELIRPCSLGAAAVIHSASKYLNGHGDVMLGVAAGSQQLMSRLNETASIFGQNANPFECWLTLRGLRTLPLRMQQLCRTTCELARFLSVHPAVERVYHPSLQQHPSHELASRLYPRGTGGIIAIELRTGGADGVATVNRFLRAVPQLPFSPTLADARTTLSHPALTSHRFLSAAARAEAGISDALVRISVGLEPLELLQQEFDRGLRSLLS